MITTDIKINGVTVGQVYLRRIDSLPVNQDSEHIYTAEYYEPEKDLIKVTVTHRVSDSVLLLLEKALRSVSLRMKK